jgi:hypothetical protein
MMVNRIEVLQTEWLADTAAGAGTGGREECTLKLLEALPQGTKPRILLRLLSARLKAMPY